MPRIICEALISDEQEILDLFKQLKSLQIPFQSYRDYVYVDYITNNYTKLDMVREIFSKVSNCSIKDEGY